MAITSEYLRQIVYLLLLVPSQTSFFGNVSRETYLCKYFVGDFPNSILTKHRKRLWVVRESDSRQRSKDLCRLFFRILLWPSSALLIESVEGVYTTVFDSRSKVDYLVRNCTSQTFCLFLNLWTHLPCPLIYLVGKKRFEFTSYNPIIQNGTHRSTARRRKKI